MSTRIENYKDFENGEPVKNEKGNSECVTLVQKEMMKKYPGKDVSTGKWGRGRQVKRSSLSEGTIIACFDSEGRYLNISGTNHTAFFKSQDQTGITMVEQYNNIEKIRVKTYKFLGGSEKIARENGFMGTYKRTYDGDNYHVVELPY